MGAVYEGVREDDFRKRVAIKLVKYSFDSDFARRRFQQERQILARLDHPNIARLLDGGDYQNRVPYLVMEFIEGKPLLPAAANLGIPAKLRLFQKVLSAVAFAHRHLIVHRDLKPANILVTDTGEPKLLDFGIARLLGEDGGTAHTMTAGAMMTPDYASPEQAKGEPAGVASDIYSLGATLYELLSGRAPAPAGILLHGGNLSGDLRNRTAPSKRSWPPTGECNASCAATWTPWCSTQWPRIRRTATVRRRRSARKSNATWTGGRSRCDAHRRSNGRGNSSGETGWRWARRRHSRRA